MVLTWREVADCSGAWRRSSNGERPITRFFKNYIQKFGNNYVKT